ncbi:MAG: 2-isopropylmalate synthase [Nitrospirae bacterium]|nr:2-isopropylmalate synthase [Candidatus Troglogloeales bacterium]MBI3597889.1 2-isopropylmalate synthase [Candidatus Troglogloeales bacterium]
MPKIVKIFDTTLRDGEQCPGASMNKSEKLTVARMLERLNVDIIEAGFPFASKDDFKGVQLIAQEIKGPVIAGLARAREQDIDAAWEAVRFAERGRIHTFLATSEIHMKHKLRMNREEVLASAVAAVRHARRKTSDVEFSPEDATRSDHDFLCRVIEVVIDAGATTINIPDTVGYTIPDEFARLIRLIRNKVPNIDRATISVHCHNDLGLAVANSLAAISAGAGQVECTVNGIGERAGNTSMEEIVMALRVRKDFFNADTNIHAEEITKASRLVSGITGFVVQPNKAIVGSNAFAHESGIHQDGLLKEKQTYEIMTPASVGLTEHKMVLGKHSGRHAFLAKLTEMGYSLKEEEIDATFERFKKIADQKKEIFEEDLEAIVLEKIYQIPDLYALKSLYVESGTEKQPTAIIELEIEGTLYKDTGSGDGPVDAVYRTLRTITKTQGKLLSYSVKAITGGTDALGEVTVRLQEEDKTFFGHGADTDIMIASAKAYINALNKSSYTNIGRQK